MGYRKKLIEVALPLEAINKASSQEKAIRYGLPATLHRWWARRPLAAARAVIFSSLVDDPSSRPDEFPTEEAQTAERERLFRILAELVKWENSNDIDILQAAKKEIMKSTEGKLPPLLDPFSGGGSIPLEAQRLGLEAHASDLNPVAVIINKAMIEIPSMFAARPPVNPESSRLMNEMWEGVNGLTEDVIYYGEWMRQEAIKRIGHLYPKALLPKTLGGGEASVISWIWARTIKCPNPACNCEMPLVSSFVLTKKKGREAYIQPIFNDKSIAYEVREGKSVPEPSKLARGAKFRCIRCGEAASPEHIKNESASGRMGAVLMAVVAEGKNGRIYLKPDDAQIQAATVERPDNCPTGELSEDRRAIWTPIYGLDTIDKLFTNRQLQAMVTFSELVSEAQAKVTADAEKAGFENDPSSLKDGGKGSVAYGQAIGVYLATLVDKLADSCNSLCPWEPVAQCPRQLFARQGIPMIWDFAEANPLGNSSGSWSTLLSTLKGYFSGGAFNFLRDKAGIAIQYDAQSDIGLRNVLVSTDPPYYDNIGYADLSDFFYVWLRKSLKGTYPDLFKTMLVPKVEELVAIPYRFEGNVEKARDFFESGMYKTCEKLREYTDERFPVSIFYAYKQSESDEGYSSQNTASTGWETMLSAIINAGFSITGTWPMRTEMTAALKYHVNALASSIVLVCRKRPANALTTTRRDFINCLKHELKPALHKLQMSNIAPVDLAQSAIGPGIGVYSRFSKVLEADGTPMSVRSALQIINQELDLYFTEQDGDLDRESRFCVDLYTQYAFNDVAFGEADVLARAKNTSVEKMASSGLLYAQKGVVRLRTRDEISTTTDGETIWILTQQLTSAIENDGVLGAAGIVCDILTSEPEQAKALAYRLYTIAERKGWAGEAYAYNSLVVAWPEVQSKAAELRSKQENGKQMKLFETDNN